MATVEDEGDENLGQLGQGDHSWVGAQLDLHVYRSTFVIVCGPYDVTLSRCGGQEVVQETSPGHPGPDHKEPSRPAGHTAAVQVWYQGATRFTDTQAIFL